VVNGKTITEMDVAPMLAGGLDKANAVDRAINREIAASMARRQYASEVATALAATERELAASIYASKELKKLLERVTDEDIKYRYDTLVNDADFNGYKLTFAVFGAADDARTAIEQAKAGKPEATKLFLPVSTGKNGVAQFISRNEVPYNLGVFVSKLKEGEFTEPSLVRNGYIVLRALEIKKNQKPTLESVKESLRSAIAEEQLTKRLTEQRKAASVSLK